MLETAWANVIAKRTVAMSPTCAEKERVIVYGYELMITSTVGVLLLIVCSAASGLYLAWIPFIIRLAPFRTVAHSYHAPRYALCYLVTTAIF